MSRCCYQAGKQLSRWLLAISRNCCRVADGFFNGTICHFPPLLSSPRQGLPQKLLAIPAAVVEPRKGAFKMATCHFPPMSVVEPGKGLSQGQLAMTLCSCCCKLKRSFQDRYCICHFPPLLPLLSGRGEGFSQELLANFRCSC